MQNILERCRSHCTSAWVAIPDVGAGAAKLYLLNGGTWPPTPVVGDFAYDLKNSTMHLFKKDGWHNVMMQDVASRLWNPTGNGSIVGFTHRGLPFWTGPDDDEDDEPCEFSSVEHLVEEFVQRFDPAKTRISFDKGPKRRREEAEADAQEDDMPVQLERDDGPREKRLRLEEHSNLTEGVAKRFSRFVESSVGIPEETPRIRWQGGFETFMPFAGMRTKLDLETLHVEELASRQSLEASESGSEPCGSGSDPFRVNELIVEIELDQVLRAPDGEDHKALESAWESLIHRIRTYMSKSTSVVIRGWTPQLRLRFSKASMSLQFGDLGMRCQWVDGCIVAANRDFKPEKQAAYHKFTTMAELIEKVEDPTVCGNFLDGKDMNAGTPVWAKPLIDSTIAWEHTMHLRFLKQASTRNKDPEVEIVEDAPEVIRSGTWSSQGWRLVTHPGFLTLPHHDCCGMGTYVVGNSGAKLWAVMRPKRDVCPSSLKGLRSSLTIASELSPEGEFSDADIATVCLEEGDVMFQPPGVLHSVYTPVPSIFSGGYFYSYDTMHLTRGVLALSNVEQKGSLTNDHRAGYLRTLCRMVIGLRYRSEPREIGKRSLISLFLIVIQCKNPEKTTSKLKNTLADEERGELAFAAKIAQSILKWMDLTEKTAIEFVGRQGAYYLPGNETVQLPLPQTIFSDMKGVM
ncbi:hypothetical protein L210DRAFT_3658740 [Boletus edulis BED1]|uniref:JmjC domain-containing protein n=1 Tax=Boletus edulis BED1 TaxID=1328754 RepID=A0AAD4B9J9_BOLED|nr:hypothetical protein L210DRAFT_3658740 [Boletus edulis BED1]